jgi:hypothetical protein
MFSTLLGVMLLGQTPADFDAQARAALAQAARERLQLPQSTLSPLPPPTPQIAYPRFQPVRVVSPPLWYGPPASGVRC